MNEKSIYENVASNCGEFYPRFDVLRSCPQAAKASCVNCRNFENSVCSLGLFDTIAKSDMAAY